MEAEYHNAATTPGDIFEHIPTLYEYAKKCEYITELGSRSCVSTWAFIKGLNENQSSVKKLTSVDLEWHPNIDRVAQMCAPVEFKFINDNSIKIVPEQTDMTFIDTWHVYGHLKRELALHAPVTRKYIIMHDTEVDGVYGETLRFGWNANAQSIETGIPVDEITKGLLPAIDEFLEANPEWTREAVWLNNHGLTVLKRTL